MGLVFCWPLICERSEEKIEIVNKPEVLDEIRRGRADLLDALAGLPDDAMLRAGVVGIWSVKDVLAHLTVWESELITALSQLDRPTHVPEIVEIEDIDEFNAEQYRTNARRSLPAVLEDFHGVHKHLIQTIEELDDKTLDNARRFPWMEGEPISYLVAENGFWHEQEHADDIRRWRKEQGI
jgi:uncharacterized damage-inducible protein DinB